ncbi:hypothetical protein HHK36_012105 [Tetracentron sinense]|uniref:Uncharacterized protein n=1 Tax=Tetracentron sinense TaxID=13715 RepID=A0A834ZEA8_TETSI|nr:hypothetical protein HHK36_012105 [Tetracentron sinense]
MQLRARFCCVAHLITELALGLVTPLTRPSRLVVVLASVYGKAWDHSVWTLRAFMPHKNIMKLFERQRCLPGSDRSNNFPEIGTQSVKDIKSEIIIINWMIDECNLIDKGFHGMQIIRNGTIPRWIKVSSSLSCMARVRDLLTYKVSSIEDDPQRGDSNTEIDLLSDCEEIDNITSSVVLDPILPLTLQLVAKISLPEQLRKRDAPLDPPPGRTVHQWQHPPPPLESFEFPTVVIPSLPSPSPLLHQCSPISINPCNNNNCCTMNKKRSGLLDSECSDSSTNTKYQRVILH